MEIEADDPRDVDQGAMMAGYLASPEVAERAVHTVMNAYLDRRGGRSGTVRFPGPNPISMDPEHLEVVLARDYVVSPKVDGTRFQLVMLPAAKGGGGVGIAGGGGGGSGGSAGGGGGAAAGSMLDRCALVDRLMRTFVPTYLNLPASAFDGSGTVLDAEMVGGRPISGLTRYPRPCAGASWRERSEQRAAKWAEGTPTGSGTSLLYVFDAVLVGGVSVRHLDYRRRMEVVSNLLATGDAGPGYFEVGFGDHLLLPILLKPIFPKERAAEVMQHPERFGVTVPTDGVVLTPIAEPVKLGRHWTMFKVKVHHTIDLRLVLVPKRQAEGYTNPLLSITPAVAERMHNTIMKHAIAAATPTKQGLLAFAAKAGPKKPTGGAGGQRSGESTGAIAAQRGTAGAASSSGFASAPACSLRSRQSGFASSRPHGTMTESRSSGKLQWVLRLEYMSQRQSVDATREGIMYNGHQVLLRVKEDEAVSRLLDEVEHVWRSMDGGVMTLSLIVECRISLTQAHFGSSYQIYTEVEVERTRPDKDVPNDLLTITNTFTSILKGVTAEHLRVLEQPGSSHASSLSHQPST